MKLGAGTLKDRLGIQAATVTKGQYGGQESAWVTQKTRSCDLRPLRSSEFYRGSGENVHSVYEILFRWEVDLIDETMRLIDTRVSPNRVFDVEAVDDIGNEHKVIKVTARERKWPSRG